MADQEPLDTTSQDADQLPERIRVHALAKRLGVTSKRILAKLGELGSEARSPQSNVERAVAESVRDALAAPDTEPAAAAPPVADTQQAAAASPVEQAVSAAVPDEPVPTEAEATTAPPETPGADLFATAPAFSPPGGLFASPVKEEPPVVEPVVFESAVVAAPLFLSPDAAAAEELRKKRRRVEPEAPSADEDAAKAEDVEDETADEQDGAEQSESDDQPRRRRRGRRGRGRGRGEQHADSDDEQDADERGPRDKDAARDKDEAPAQDASTADESEAEETKQTEAESTDDGEDGAEGSTRRRRRRRRRKVAGEGGGENEPADDDPPNTVVHEREPRNKSRARAVDEVQGITGSTRLEAKRQRRRDGREAGRRRPPILTESEFLARRESVDRVMVVREKEFPGHPTATQVAVLEDNILVEHFVTSTGQASMVGNVYLGKVQNVLPSMEAAFVDIGRGRNGVLYAGEVNWEAAGLGGKERKIEQALKPGDQVLVQVSKDPVGHKGARLTTQISLAGRFLVYVPGGTSTGISRKLPDTERKRLKEILREIVPPDAGVIIRTASEGVSEAELARDVERLQATWRTIEKAAEQDSGAPKTLYEEPDLLVKVIRDLFNEDFSKLVIEGERSWSTVETYIRTVAPDLLARVSRHENNGVDVFEAYRIDEQLAKALDRKVWLPSGGTLVIDRTEAMTVIDVNTGKFTGSGNSNLEETVTRNNLEAAEEIVRQMRLRDIGGMIVVDFIDMVLESNRDLVLRRLTEALGRDRTRHQVSEVTSLGLVQMTRKKLGTGLVEAFSTTCEHCHGRGILVHSYPVEPGAAEDGAGRGRESGSRRRRGRDKAAAPAAPQAQPAVAELSEEEAAVKRAHPVALAMAAHQAEESGAAQPEPQPSETAAEPAAAEQAREATGEPAAEAVAAAQNGTTRTRSTRRRRVARSAAAPDADAVVAVSEVVTEVGAPAEQAAASAVEPAAVADQDVPAEQAAVAEPVQATDADHAEPVAAVEPAPAADQAPTAEVTAEGKQVSVVEPGAAEAAPAAVTTEPVVAEPVEAVAAEPAATAEPAEPEPAAPPAAPAENGTTARSTRRRRVARSAAAPASDSTGAVFVLSSAEEPAAPVVDFAEPVPVPVPERRPRRRSAGRPAGPPPAESADE
ncbi:translation initiation factor IF-2 N-terminal domain-containing protein [Nocardia cyriacigeorgica]|uniref:translation initiation factor IF-2 N-terminal domain-containing protein n=1 Tax=Nocardia cyriacigeorgica TaxID=135487 RepID=UPI0013D8B131|nr:translation initiation factor IF-2 N-terminal domain-containing protein [Nocardia cyriacigeorgica]NEW29073.1 Rne/Rng family ribonuclease [Nocardia cyriacigeorgica]